jgi:hypothetical protein
MMVRVYMYDSIAYENAYKAARQNGLVYVGEYTFDETGGELLAEHFELVKKTSSMLGTGNVRLVVEELVELRDPALYFRSKASE